MAPKKKVKRSKTQKNKPWTDKQTNIFAAVLSSTDSRDKPYFDKNTNGLRNSGRRSMQVSEVAVVWERKTRKHRIDMTS